MSLVDCGELEALRAGRREACQAFVDAHYRGVYGFFLWLTNDRDSAADLTQETFAAFWESVADPARAVGTDLKAWLYGIARNRWRKRCRDRRPSRSLDDALLVPETLPGPESLTIGVAEADRIIRAVASLPADYREALVLRVFQELGYRQVAAALGISEGLARWRVHQGRLRLLRELTREDEEGSRGPD